MRLTQLRREREREPHWHEQRRWCHTGKWELSMAHKRPGSLTLAARSMLYWMKALRSRESSRAAAVLIRVWS